ncbi:hypothetical protein DSM100685_0442 [Bifidobacterium avesanii]|nr:hypothetical protein DSM100685_0442 [Bifidobacterium avesanii]
MPTLLSLADGRTPMGDCRRIFADGCLPTDGRLRTGARRRTNADGRTPIGACRRWSIADGRTPGPCARVSTARPAPRVRISEDGFQRLPTMIKDRPLHRLGRRGLLVASSEGSLIDSPLAERIGRRLRGGDASRSVFGKRLHTSRRFPARWVRNNNFLIAKREPARWAASWQSPSDLQLWTHPAGEAQSDLRGRRGPLRLSEPWRESIGLPPVGLSPSCRRSRCPRRTASDR